MQLTELPGIGPALAAKFAALGVQDAADLLFHLPLRYEDRTRLLPLGQLGEARGVLACGQVLSCAVRFGRRRSLLVQIADSTGELQLRLFHFSRRQQLSFRQGQWLQVFGDVRRTGDHWVMVHPEYRLVADPQAAEPVEARLTPVYPATAGLSQSRIRTAVERLLPRLPELAPDLVGDFLDTALHQALHDIHAPPADDHDAVGRARARLVLEELLAHRLAMLRLRRLNQANKAPVLRPGELCRRMCDALPFALTAAQARCVEEIGQDMAASRPMLRLLQGDVGAGKTVVAALAAARAMDCGLRVLLMAPTEILARQHHSTLSQWFEPLGVTVPLWLGGTGERSLPETGPALIVGTHALFHSEQRFGAVGLVIVDEQHRFGVDQRLGLRELAATGGCHPHQLVMTATPIPRTLAQTLFADLDFSAIDELPPGRTPVQTVALPQARRGEVIERLRLACAQGRQAYWVSPVIEASEWAEAAEDIQSELEQALPELRIGLVHGRLKRADKQAVMTAFSDGELDILVATTVIEVGVDVPNASVMVIDNAERMGLAQLHQLRGRVGRGSVASHCVLMYRPPLTDTARARLDALRQTHDGFALAERDLELRGAGEILGTRQSGMAEFRIADPQRDAAYLPQVRELAEQIARGQPEKIEPLLARWLPDARKYADA